MDPKGGQILDPKLKEAYDRVMGASIPQAAPTPPPAVTHPQPTTPPPVHAETPKIPEHHEAPPSAATHPGPPPPAPHTATPATPGTAAPVHATMSFAAGYVAPHAEKKAPVSGPLLVIAGIIFLMVYTLFWMKWFGMTIPFLP